MAINEEGCRSAQPARCAGTPAGVQGLPEQGPDPLNQLARRKIREIYKNRKSADKILFLAAQEKLNYEGIIRILDIARTAGDESLKVGIVSDEKPSQAELNPRRGRSIFGLLQRGGPVQGLPLAFRCGFRLGVT